jgi:hypothetical protein
MSKKLSFTYQDKEYCLEFTRKSITQMERNGFVASDITTKPMSTLPALFAGAFLANHRYIKPETVDEIYEKMVNKDGLIEKLAEMYREPIEALMNEPEEAEGNLNWTTSW